MGCNNSHLHIPSQNANIRPAYNKELVSELELELELGLELKVLLELQLEVPMELVMELVLQLVVLMEFEVLEMERCKINIARIANAVQVTIYILVSTNVYKCVLVCTSDY